MTSSTKITDMTLPLVKSYLRVEYEEDDILICVMMSAAESFIQSYLNRRFSDMVEIPNEFTIAYLAIIGHWYEKREIQGSKHTAVELSYVFAGVLDMHRHWNVETGEGENYG